jgi:NOL1/NOP2/fmu family ribosome biogenesis protein
LFRKDADAIDHWSLESVDMCASRQKDILSDALATLKPGGTLIYSTCSYSTSENEAIADWLLQKEYQSLAISLEGNRGIVETISENKKAAGYRFYPDKLKGEGFFIAAFRKKEDPIEDSRPPKNKLKFASPKELEVIAPFMQKNKNIHFVKWEEHILALPDAVMQVLQLLQSHLYVKKAGVNVGSVIRDELIPHHELAMSTLLAEVPSVEVSELAALDFLRRKDIGIQSPVKGWLLLKFNNIPLGWIKNMGNRINNYYPKEWRILNK